MAGGGDRGAGGVTGVGSGFAGGGVISIDGVPTGEGISSGVSSNSGADCVGLGAVVVFSGTLGVDSITGSGVVFAGWGGLGN